MTTPLLDVDGLRKWFPIRRGWFGRTTGAVRAVDGVSFRVAAGETVACVGESGSGKSTLGRTLLRLLEPDAGTIRVHGPEPERVRHVERLEGADLRKLRRELQIVFQDPYASLNPRMRVVDLVGEGLVIHDLAHAGPSCANSCCANWSGSGSMRRRSIAIRTRFRAANGSASRSRARSP
jgi:ABC-type microcin C transport system duplicated ATPase subunit YejF